MFPNPYLHTTLKNGLSLFEYTPQENIILVSKSNGNDLNNGLDRAVETIQKATEIRDTIVGNVVINILDSKSYAESFAIKADTLLYFPFATIDGQIQQDANSFVKGWYLKNLTGDCIEAGGFTGTYYFDIEFLHVIGDFHGVKQQNGLNRPLGFIKNLIIEDPVTIASNGISVTSGLAPIPCNIEIKEVHLIGTGDAPRVVSYTADSSSGIGKVKIGKITTAAGVTNSTGIYCGNNGAFEVSVDSGYCTKAYETANSTRLILLGNTNLQGSVVENSSVPIETRIGRFKSPSIIGTAGQSLNVNVGGTELEWKNPIIGAGNKKILPNRAFQIINVPALVTTWFQNDNLPLISEGVLIDQLTYTPSAIGKELKIFASYFLGRTPDNFPFDRVWGHLAVFLTGINTALSMEPHLYILNDLGDTPIARLDCTAFYTTTTALLHTFQVRIGHNGFGINNNMTLNGSDTLGAGSRRGGGSLLSYIEIQEVN